MSDLSDSQIARLQNDVQTGQIIRAFCQHPGFKIYREALDAIIEDKKNAWLKGDDEEARKERIRAQGVQKAVDVLKQFILLGDNANKLLEEQQSHVR